LIISELEAINTDSLNQLHWGSSTGAAPLGQLHWGSSTGAAPLGQLHWGSSTGAAPLGHKIYNKQMRKFWFLKGFAMVAAFIIIGGFAVMGLWNWLIPSIFGLAAITWIQALGLLVLSKILFGDFFGGWSGGCGGNRHHFWKQKMADRMANMSSEEKEQFKEKIKIRWEK
jgi:hypothetical protein